MAAFPPPSSVNTTPYLTNSAGLSPLLESVEAGSRIVSTSCPVDDWYGAYGQATHSDFYPLLDNDSFLALYDLCRGDVELLDRVRGPGHTSPMPPTPTGKANPVVPLRVPTKEPTRRTQTPRSTPRSLSPAAVHPPLQNRRGSRSTSRVQFAPYRTAGKPRVLIQSKVADKGKPDRKYFRRSSGKEEYVRRYGAASITPLDGLTNIDLNSPLAKGQWREILVDVLNQVGVPYSLHGLKVLIAGAYGVKIISGRGAKRHPENRWQVRPANFPSL